MLIKTVAYKLSTQKDSSGMSSQFGKNNSELNNPLKERIKLLMTAEELEKPYSFATRVGLSKGTFTGIWVEGRTSLHKKTIDKIAEATGANQIWLMTGAGEPFQQERASQKIEQNCAEYLIQTQSEDIKNKKTDVPLSIDKYLLTQSIETAEKALDIAKGTMTPDDKAEFISTLYFNDNVNNVSEELLKACISLIEQALKETRRTLSPEPKSELIIVIYNFYYDKPWTEEHLKSALDQLIRSVS